MQADCMGLACILLKHGIPLCLSLSDVFQKELDRRRGGPGGKMASGADDDRDGLGGRRDALGGTERREVGREVGRFPG